NDSADEVSSPSCDDFVCSSACPIIRGPLPGLRWMLFEGGRRFVHLDFSVTLLHLYRLLLLIQRDLVALFLIIFGSAAVKRPPEWALHWEAVIMKSCLSLRHFPTYWKLAKLVLIPKAGNVLVQPENYLPIYLPGPN
ncbi:hypothetical protein J6590_102283, partial [Homalodisca vitripennis]